ncbi:MAG: hypothetical protein GX748_10570, partial [Lentisphaerae bacterium]|nr:hypothetical protein [Lentisphaerota bacterium]
MRVTGRRSRMLAAILVVLSLSGSPLFAGNTNVNANADDFALYCSWDPEFCCNPGTFDFYASVSCQGKTPDPEVDDVEILAYCNGHLIGATPKTKQFAHLMKGNVPPCRVDAVFSGGGDGHSQPVYVMAVVIDGDKFHYCHKHDTSSKQLNLNETGSQLDPGVALWSPSPFAGSGDSIPFTPSVVEVGTYSVKAASSVLATCYDTCEVNIVEVDVNAEGCVCVTNGTAGAASRKQLTINKCVPASWDGHVQLFWTGGGGVKVYTDASGGAEVASGMSFANESLPTNLWVEGTVPSAAVGDVVFRLNPVEAVCPNAAEGCDRGTMTVVRVDVDVDGLS